MGDLFWNKIFGAILGTFLIVFALNEVSHILYHPHELEEPAYVIEVVELGAGPEEPAGPFDLGAALMAASASNGARQARKCAACHTFDEGGATLQGPNLWNIVGRTTANVAGFGYSGSMRELGGAWDYDSLWGFLENPRAYLPGTAMSFAGLRKEDQRADLIAYLQAQSGSPVAFPAAFDAAPAEAAAAALVDEASQASGALADMVEDASETASELADATVEAVEHTAEAVGDMTDDAQEAADEIVADETVNGAIDDIMDDVTETATPDESGDADPSDD